MLLCLKTPNTAAAVRLLLLRNSCCLGNSNAGQVELRGRAEGKEYNCSLLIFVFKYVNCKKEIQNTYLNGLMES